MPSRTLTLGNVRSTVGHLAAHQKSSTGVAIYSRFINRPVGRWFAAIAFHLGATPNQVTLTSGAVTLTGIAAILLLGPSVAGAIAVTLLLVVGYALDSADGQLARLRGGGSSAGEWLDHVVDCVKISSLHSALLIALFREGVPTGWLLLPIGYLIAANVYFFAYILGDLLRRTKGIKPTRGGRASVIRALIVAPLDYGILCLSFVLFFSPPIFLAIYALLLAGHVGYLGLGLPKWFRDMQHLDAG